jgi:hypothetical protein
METRRFPTLAPLLAVATRYVTFVFLLMVPAVLPRYPSLMEPTGELRSRRSFRALMGASTEPANSPDPTEAPTLAGPRTRSQPRAL